MKGIHLLQTLPNVFADNPPAHSDIWLRDVTFRKGEMYLLEAASGTGKTSLCSFLYGLRNDYRGRICFDETDIRSLSIRTWTERRRSSLSLLFQDLRLFPELTVDENTNLKNNLTHHQPAARLTDWLEAVGLADKRHTPVGRLSFGQQQRVAFLRALCQPFDFIFLDEPVSHLDEANGAILRQLLLEEVGRQGAGVVVTSIGRHIDLPYDRVFRL